MDALHIGRMHNRYRLRRDMSSAQMRVRLDRVLRAVLEENLEATLAHRDLDRDEHLCIRRVHARLRLAAQRSDAALALDWSLGLTEAIVAALRIGGSQVVRYRSRRHALLDFACGVAAGDHARAWAWSQMGFGPLQRLASHAAIDALVQALAADGSGAVAVLSAVESAGRLPALAQRLSAAHFQALARAALDASGVAVSVLERAASPSAAASARIARLVSDTLARSPLTPFAYAPQAVHAAHAVAVLALLAGEPYALRGAGAAAAEVITVAVRILRDMTLRARGEIGTSRRDTRAPDRPSIGRRGSDLTLNVGAASEADAGSVADAAHAGDASGPASAAMRAGGPAGTTPLRARDALDGKPARDVARPASGEADDATLPDARRIGSTAWGGLLFLLWLVDRLRIPDAACAEAAFEQRSLRWVLHAIALALLQIAADDPAALAFAGLMPDAVPPDAQEAPAGKEEQALIAGYAGSIAGALRDCLQEPVEDRGRLLQRVCARRARIAAEPGWIEVRLQSNAVSSAVRRCGLDLDLDYLPWLGAVVKFIYE
jgi:hypothetical protein